MGNGVFFITRKLLPIFIFFHHHLFLKNIFHLFSQKYTIYFWRYLFRCLYLWNISLCVCVKFFIQLIMIKFPFITYRSMSFFFIINFILFLCWTCMWMWLWLWMCLFFFIVVMVVVVVVVVVIHIHHLIYLNVLKKNIETIIIKCKSFVSCRCLFADGHKKNVQLLL